MPNAVRSKFDFYAEQVEWQRSGSLLDDNMSSDAWQT